MLFPKIKKIGRFYHLERTNHMVLGKIKNTLVRLYDGNNMKGLIMTFPKITEDDKEAIHRLLQSQKIKKEQWDNTVIFIEFPEYFWPHSTKRIKKVIDLLSEYSNTTYKDLNVPCDECGTNQEIDPFAISNGSMFLCSSCRQKIIDDLNSQIEEYKRIPKNYRLGSLGAFLFSLLGIPFSFFLFIFPNHIIPDAAAFYIQAFLSMSYIYFAMKGYRLFKGKVDKIGAALMYTIGATMAYIGIYISLLLATFYEAKSMEAAKEIMKLPKFSYEIHAMMFLTSVILFFYIGSSIFDVMKEWKFPKLTRARKIN